MRHAKSSWATGEVDHQRPLNKRGRRDAPFVAGQLNDREWIPDLVLSSDSRRTQETWERMAPVFGKPIDVHFLRSLYLAGTPSFQAVLENLPSDRRTVLVLGHNPGWEEIAGQLSGYPVRMTTANALLAEKAASDWVEVIHGAGQWKTHGVLRPRSPKER